MATLVQQARVLKGMANKETLDQVAILAASSSKGLKEIVELNKEQLSVGRNNLGNLIGRYGRYTKEWAEDADRISDPSRKSEGFEYDFQWSGDFFKKMTAKRKGDEIDISSNVFYINALQALGARNRAQNKLFGLSNDNMYKFIRTKVLKKVLIEMKNKLAQRNLFGINVG